MLDAAFIWRMGDGIATENFTIWVGVDCGSHCKLETCACLVKQIEISSEIMERTMPLTPDELLKILDEKGYETTTIEHEALFSVDQSQELRGKISGGHTKNLFVKDKKGNFFLLVVEENARIDLNRLHPKIGARSRLSFGKPEYLMAHLGVMPGSVTAFSVINDKENKVKLIIDEPLLAHEKINCHPLTNEMTTTISREDLLQFLTDINHKPEIIQMSEFNSDNNE